MSPLGAMELEVSPLEVPPPPPPWKLRLGSRSALSRRGAEASRGRAAEVTGGAKRKASAAGADAEHRDCTSPKREPSVHGGMCRLKCAEHACQEPKVKPHSGQSMLLGVVAV